MNRAALTRRPLAPLALAVVVAGLPALLARADETEEPRERFTLEIEGRSVELAVDVPFELTLGDVTHPVVLRRAPTRVLAAAGVTFEYPRGMTFEYEADFGSRIWTLDGNDAVLMLFEFAAELELSEFVDSQVEAYETLGGVERRPATLELAGKEIAGAWLGVGSDLFSLAVEVFPVPDGSGQRWLVLQDSRDDVEDATEEYLELRRLLSATYKSAR